MVTPEQRAQMRAGIEAGRDAVKTRAAQPIPRQETEA